MLNASSQLKFENLSAWGGQSSQSSPSLSSAFFWAMYACSFEIGSVNFVLPVSLVGLRCPVLAFLSDRVDLSTGFSWVAPFIDNRLIFKLDAISARTSTG
eukprot:TRINITY_DN3406_c0_g1_i1.p1 TRINITY_DN3406_c0_g1~~TRINITY_DN3406_c0_g1_i1.p1  ORF type:complete len:100 (+),score=7.87 TRINITY_DN3406_c0_g1_i1:149-448(+)